MFSQGRSVGTRLSRRRTLVAELLGTTERQKPLEEATMPADARRTTGLVPTTMKARLAIFCALLVCGLVALASWPFVRPSSAKMAVITFAPNPPLDETIADISIADLAGEYDLVTDMGFKRLHLSLRSDG